MLEGEARFIPGRRGGGTWLPRPLKSAIRKCVLRYPCRRLPRPAGWVSSESDRRSPGRMAHGRGKSPTAPRGSNPVERAGTGSLRGFGPLPGGAASRAAATPGGPSRPVTPCRREPATRPRDASCRTGAGFGRRPHWERPASIGRTGGRRPPTHANRLELRGASDTRGWRSRLHEFVDCFHEIAESAHRRKSSAEIFLPVWRRSQSNRSTGRAVDFRSSLNVPQAYRAGSSSNNPPATP
jgi:hypothetical protein